MTEVAGLKALVVEDEAGIALLIEDMLCELGCEVVGIAALLDEALAVARTALIDFALLDVNLDGKSVFPVALVLRNRRIPFVFSTGCGVSGLPPEFTQEPVLSKPFTIEQLHCRILAALKRNDAQAGS